MKRIITLITLVLVSASTLMYAQSRAKHAKQSVKPNAKARKHAKKRKMKGTIPLPSRH